MSGGGTPYDNRYDIGEKGVRNLIEKIESRGHIIGIHPSYDAYNDADSFVREKERLESVCSCDIREGRQHYLRFEVPFTWRIWEANGMETDSTCGYADREGFRCGTGDLFRVFDILERKPLSLKERPLVFMDDNRFEEERVEDEDELLFILKEFVKKSKKYRMPLTVLFHQNIFVRKYIDYRKIYETLVACHTS